MRSRFVPYFVDGVRLETGVWRRARAKGRPLWTLQRTMGTSKPSRTQSITSRVCTSQHTLYQVPVARLHQLCAEWDLVNEIFAEKDGGDEKLRTGTSNTADITLGALLDGEGVVRGRGDRAMPPGTQQASRQHSPMSSQGVEDTLPDLPPPLIDPFDPSQPNSQTNSQDGARTHSVREKDVRYAQARLHDGHIRYGLV